MPQDAGQGLGIHPTGEGVSGEGVPLRYNNDKQKKPCVPTVFRFAIVYSIPFPTLIDSEKNIERRERVKVRTKI